MPSWVPAASASMEGAGVWLAAILTLAVLSAAFVENKVSRFAFGLLIGASAGYVAALTWQEVLQPRLLLVLRDPLAQWPILVWFALGLLLLTRGLTSVSWLSSLSLAYLIGVGMALAVGGAVLGTAIPQMMAVVAARGQVEPGSWLGILNVLLVAVGTGAVLFRFAYTGWTGKGPVGKVWNRVVGLWGRLGYLFLLVAFGALFATAMITLLGLLAARVQFLLGDWLRLLPG